MGSAEFWDSGVLGESALDGTGGADGGGPALVNALISDHPWDTVWLAGYALPGHCKVMDGTTEIGIDNKKPDGADGSTITVKGYRPGPFEVSCTVWTLDQWEYLKTVIDVVWRKPKKKAKLAEVAIDVSHPALQLFSISSAVVKGVTFPQDADFAGGKTVRFKMQENVPPGAKNQTATVRGGSTTIEKRLQQQKRLEGALPVNAGPGKPSQDKKELSSRGAPAAPANGSF